MSPPAQHLARIRDAARLAGQWCAVASLFVVPINKPATNVALVLTLLFSLIGSDTWQRWRHAARHPVAIGALVWWGVLMLSALHTWDATSTWPLKGSFVWACWYPLVLGSLLVTPAWRRRALTAFALATGLVLLISCAMALGLVPQRAVAHIEPAMRDTVFKEYTQQGLALLILGSMAMAAALTTASKVRQRLFLAIAALVLINTVFMTESRTAYVTLIPVAGYWLWRVLFKERAKLRSVLIVSMLLLSGLAAIWFTPLVQQRLVGSVTHELELYSHQHAATSTGIRLELWRRTLPIIASAPIFGHGLHQWAPIYRQSIAGVPNDGPFLMGHPHQEMLLILAEQGMAGLLIFLLLLGALARYIRRLEPPERDIYACTLLVYLTAGLANCLWADFTHRHLFILLLACMPLAGRRISPQQVQARVS